MPKVAFRLKKVAFPKDGRVLLSGSIEAVKLDEGARRFTDEKLAALALKQLVANNIPATNVRLHSIGR
jgi:hypothetical protein